jgi:peptide-methionine (S)-S-oxide reductase
VYRSSVSIFAWCHAGATSAADQADFFSEGVLLEYDTQIIDLSTLIEVHLYTHSSTAQHSMRSKYRSAIYTTSAQQAVQASASIASLQVEFEQPIITEVCTFMAFRENIEAYRNYYFQNPQRPFCTNYIHPKLRLLQERFAQHVHQQKITIPDTDERKQKN